MQESFKVLSLSHRKAAVDVRELMHLSDQAASNLASNLNKILGLEEVLVLSTCNRTEIYFSSAVDRSMEVLRLLCMEKGIGNPLKYEHFFEYIDDEAAAVRHLFRVAMGLDSQVIGDLQISNQVKLAYAASAKLNLAGPFLHRLMHTIFHANKRVQQETPYRDGAASISYASAELAKELVNMHQQPSILVVGMGEMGRDVAKNLANSFDRIALSNRTDAKAAVLAEEIGAEMVPHADLYQALKDHTVVISAVSGDTPIFRPEHFQGLADFQQKFLIDLCVPRSVDPAVENIPGILVYDIDEIKTRTDETVSRRIAAIPAVEAIIDSEMSGFNLWRKELSISPVIQRFKEALEDIRKDELARYLKNASEQESQLAEKITKSMINKIIKLPVLQLKAACQRGEEENLAEVLNDLFNLEAMERSPNRG